MMILAALLAWVGVGAVLGIYEARRGHWRWIWVLYVLAGPFALNLSRLIEENERLSRPIPLDAQTGGHRAGLRILAGVDGSVDSLDAVRAAVDLLGSRGGDITLAMVVQFEIHESRTGSPADEEPWRDGATAVLHEARTVVADGAGFEPSTVLLSGAPADALVKHAEALGFDVIVVGRRGRGLSRFLLGSCASRLAKQAGVPTLIVPPTSPPGSRRSVGRTVVTEVGAEN